jgi:anti-anti-sigma regulatory factor
MVMRIERASDDQLTILHLSGWLQLEHVDQLKAQIEGSTQRVILDLDQVKLVDRDVALFLGVCEANGVELTRCSPFIREWINRERTSEGDS